MSLDLDLDLDNVIGKRVDQHLELTEVFVNSKVQPFMGV